MFQGRFVETGRSEALLASPAHPYTHELVAAAPKFGQGQPAPSAPPPRPEARSGCPYAARCSFARARCVEEAPELRELGSGRRAACHFPLITI
jgi:peptide/nickel transport system ATP-binding protein